MRRGLTDYPGFTIADVREPGVSPGAREDFPELFADRDDPRFLAFLFVELRCGEHGATVGTGDASQTVMVRPVPTPSTART